jgi:hypothetical protein
MALEQSRINKMKMDATLPEGQWLLADRHLAIGQKLKTHSVLSVSLVTLSLAEGERVVSKNFTDPTPLCG